MDIIVAQIGIYPGGGLAFIQQVNATVFILISVSSADGNDVIASFGNIDGGDFYVVAACPARVLWQQDKGLAGVSGLIDIS